MASGFMYFTRRYNATELVRESIQLQSVNGWGQTVSEMKVTSDQFSVLPEQPAFRSPTLESKIMNEIPIPGSPKCRIEKMSTVDPETQAVRFAIYLDGDYIGATLNGTMVRDSQQVEVGSNEAWIYRAVGTVYGPKGHFVCESFYAAPRCQIDIVENSYDLVRKKIRIWGRTESVIVDGQRKPVRINADHIMMDEVPKAVGPARSTARVLSPTGDEGTCDVRYIIPSPELRVQPVRATASSEWKHSEASKAMDGTSNKGWLSRSKPPGWIRFDLGRAVNLARIRLCADQSVPDYTAHEIWAGSDLKDLKKLATLRSHTIAGQWLEHVQPAPKTRYVEVRTLKGPSEVAWREIEIYRCSSFRACPRETPEERNAKRGISGE